VRLSDLNAHHHKNNDSLTMTDEDFNPQLNLLHERSVTTEKPSKLTSNSLANLGVVKIKNQQVF
jgi:hypothetical protein